MDGNTKSNCLVTTKNHEGNFLNHLNMLLITQQNMNLEIFV